MSSEEMKRLISAGDKEFDFACEFYYGGNQNRRPPETSDQLHAKIMARYRLLDPWYERVTASYNLVFREEVEKMYNRFAFEGLSEDGLKLPVEGRLGRENVRAIASKLWELAFRLRDKEVSIEDSVQSGIERPAS